MIKIFSRLRPARRALPLIAALAAFPIVKLIQHADDRCFGAVFDFQYMDALGLREEQVEPFEEMGGSLEKLCDLNDRFLTKVRVALVSENETGIIDTSYERFFYADDAGNPAPDLLNQARARRQEMLQQRPDPSKAAPAAGEVRQWKALGPTNVPGRSWSISVDPLDSNHLLLGSGEAGLWSSADEGRTWTDTRALPVHYPAGNITFGNVDKRLVYATITGALNSGFTVLPAYSIYRSTDSGATWAPLTTAVRTINPETDLGSVIGIALSPADDNVLIAASRCAVQRSTNAGVSWTSVYSACGRPTPGVTVVTPTYPAFDPNDPSHIVIGGQGGALVSRDGGVTWTAVPVTGVPSTSHFHTAFAPSAPGVLYAYTYPSGFQGEVYKSTDGGSSWARINNNVTNYGEYTNQIWVDPTDANVIVLGGVSLFRSTDGGASFKLINGGVVDSATNNFSAPVPGESAHNDIHGFASPANYSTANRKLFVATDGGIVMAHDVTTVTPFTWEFRSGMLGTAQYYGIAAAADGSLIVAGSQDQGLHSYQSGANWSVPIEYTDFTSAQVDQTDPAYAYSGTVYLGILRSADQGRNWTYMAQSLPDAQQGQGNFVSPILLDPHDQRRLYAGGRSLWVTADARAITVTWKEVKTPSAVAGNYVNTIAVSPSDPNIVWVGHNNGEIYMTTNARAEIPVWTRITAATSTRQVAAILIDASNANKVTVGYNGLGSNIIVRTTDGGATWTSISANLPGAPVLAIVQDPVAPATLYIATGVGVFWSFDDGASWATDTGGPNDALITDIAVVRETGALVASTYARGAFMLEGALTPRPRNPARLAAGAVYSSTQVTSQSHLRFFNTGSETGRVTVTLSHPTTGATLARWVSPAIPSGAEQQYPVGVLESGIDAAEAKPASYALSLTADVPLTFQHVLYRPADGTLTNLSTCLAGTTADPTKIAGVHSSLVGNAGFPSSVVVTNTGGRGSAAILGVYDARDGSKLGAFVTRSMLPMGQQTVSAAELEATFTRPANNALHYVVRLEWTFDGHLQHLVNNTRAGVITDMTTSCAVNGTAPRSNGMTAELGGVLSTAQTTAQSFLRFFNAGTSPGSVNVSLYDYNTGRYLLGWASDVIAAGGEIQASLAEIENLGALYQGGGGLLRVTPRYTATVAATFPVYVQHVLFRPADGTLTNLSTCRDGVTAPTKLSGVHSSLVGSVGFPSTIVVNNTGAAAATAALGLYDARDGRKLGTYTTPAIAPNGQAQVLVSTMEAGASISPSANMGHYVVQTEGPFTGFLQHLVNNERAGVITDMTAACILGP